jgi:hypothetical protein
MQREDVSRKRYDIERVYRGYEREGCGREGCGRRGCGRERCRE